MGRLDAIVDDSIEEQFRMEAIKRFGARKGNLSKALEEAMDLWIKKDVLETLKHKFTNIETSREERINLVDTMKASGMAAAPYLSDCLKETEFLLADETNYITKAIREVTHR